MSRKNEMAIYRRQIATIQSGKFTEHVAPQLVHVMARAEGYAMVRMPGCVPFVAQEAQLAPATGARQ